MSRLGLRLPLVLLALCAVPAIHADLNSVPTPWVNFNGPGWFPSLNSGSPARDFESTGGCVDPTNGGAAFSGESDISSGGAPYNVANCNPAVPPGVCCGTETSAFIAYYNGGGGGDTDISDDYFAARMRVNGDPRNDGNNCLSNSHWNFLVDNDNDGYKEWWVDTFGNEDKVRILYENNGSNSVSNADEVPPATNTIINELTACAVLDQVAPFVTCGSGGGTVTCNTSHTRVCGVTSSQSDVSDCQTTTDATGEWYVDVQIPVRFLTDSTGDMSTNPITLGGTVLSFPPLIRFFFSTSDSSINPLQKDYIAQCGAGAGGTCAFSGEFAVTLSYFRAQSTGSGMRFDWSTESESGNVGFRLLADDGSGFREITPKPVTSKNPFSLKRLDYSVEIPGVRGQRFAIEDIDLQGKARRHGAFVADREYGGRSAVELRDWSAIRAEHEAKSASRSRAEVSQARSAVNQTPLRGADVRVDRDGIQRVSFEQLAAAGLSWNGVQSSRIALVSENGPVPIRVVGPANFGPGSYVEFIGQRATGVYTRTNVYRLKLDAASALRIAEAPGTAKGAIPSYLANAGADDDLAWSFSAPGSDPWYRDWVVVWAGQPVERTYSIDVDRLADDEGARLKASIWGMTDWAAGNDHHVELWLNGTRVADRWFEGLQELVVDEAIPNGVLRPGANTLSVRAPADNGEAFEVIAVDKFSIDYRRGFAARQGALEFTSSAGRFEVDGFRSGTVTAYAVQGGAVTRVANVQTRRVPFGDYRASFGSPAGAASARYYVADAMAIATPAVSAWNASPELYSGAAEYLVISHPDFLSGLGGLISARQADGLQVKAVSVEKVYSEFGHGIFGPEAIRDYVRYAAANLGTRYVLLVGADSYDYLDQLGLGSISFVPTLYVEIGPIVRWAPADALFGDLDDDMVPEIAVGRLPVHNAAELAAVVGKTLAYPTAGHGGRAVLAADFADGDGNYADMSDDVAAEMGAGWNVERIYLDEMSVAEGNAALVAAINAGSAYTQYLGHSATSVWSFENLFTAADVASLTNQGQPTVVGQWGCWNTFYVTPDASSMADRLLLGGSNGAAAVFGASALANTGASATMSRILAEQMFGGATIGDALITAKQGVAAQAPWHLDVVRSFNLLGDPALRIQP